jgi:hypothetical protein
MAETSIPLLSDAEEEDSWAVRPNEAIVRPAKKQIQRKCIASGIANLKPRISIELHP